LTNSQVTSSSKVLLGTTIFSVAWDDVVAVRPVVVTGRPTRIERSATKAKETSTQKKEAADEEEVVPVENQNQNQNENPDKNQTKKEEVKEVEAVEEKEAVVEADNEESTGLKYAFLLFLRPPRPPFSQNPSHNTLCINGRVAVELFLTKQQTTTWILLFRAMHTRRALSIALQPSLSLYSLLDVVHVESTHLVLGSFDAKKEEEEEEEEEEEMGQQEERQEERQGEQHQKQEEEEEE